MIAALLLAVPAYTDQWSAMFDHGDRWPTCSVTYSTNMGGKAFTRAVRDVERASGVDLVRVPTGGQLSVYQTREARPDRLAEAMSTPVDGRYVSGFVTGFDGLRSYSAWVRRAVWVHEFGHALGLGHSGDPMEVMYGGGAVGWHMSPGFRSSLRALYPECAPS